MVLRVGESAWIAENALEVKAVRSSGPGGQNVNKVASRAVITVDVARIAGFGPEDLTRLRRLAGRRLTAGGLLSVACQRTRDFHRNLEEARERLRDLVARSLTPPRPRHRTRIPAAQRQRRLTEKKRTAERKRTRRPAAED